MRFNRFANTAFAQATDLHCSAKRVAGFSKSGENPLIYFMEMTDRLVGAAGRPWLSNKIGL